MSLTVEALQELCNILPSLGLISHMPYSSILAFSNCCSFSGSDKNLKVLQRHLGLQHLIGLSTLDLYVLSDADWVGCPSTRRSTAGSCTFFGSNCISWSAKKQSTVAELTLLCPFLHGIGISLSNPPVLPCDNLSALYMTVNRVFHGHSKNVEINYHFVPEKVALGNLTTRFVGSKHQIADIITKPLSSSSFQALVANLDWDDHTFQE